MKRIVLLLVFALVLSFSITAVAAPSPVVGSTVVVPDAALPQAGGATIEGVATEANAEMQALAESVPEIKESKSVLCEDMKLVGGNGEEVVGKAKVSVSVSGVTENSTVYVIVYKDGKAQLVEAEIVDGQVVFTADFPCTVEIFVANQAGEEAPKTGIASLFAWLF